MMKLGLVVAIGMTVLASAANAAIINTLATGSTSGVGGAAWSYSEAGGRFAYSAAIAECPFNGNCGASAQSISYNEYEVRFNPTQAYIDEHSVIGGILVNMTYILSAFGQATASIQWGSTVVEVGPSFGSVTQASETTQILMGSDGATGDYLAIIKLSSSANAGANGISNPGPVISVAYADPIFEPINAGSYDGEWSFSEDLSNPELDEFGQRDPNIELPIDVPQAPAPAGAALIPGALLFLGFVRRRGLKASKV